jgi:hypothetical protein
MVRPALTTSGEDTMSDKKSRHVEEVARRIEFLRGDVKAKVVKTTKHDKVEPSKADVTTK